MSLKAGVARVDISPEYSMFLTGYPHVPRMSTGIHDPLYATALYLENGGNIILSLALDIIYLDHNDVHRWRKAIQEATGIPAHAILVSVTHTHSGPNTADVLAWHGDEVVPPPDPKYMEKLKQAVVFVSVEAKKQAEPATLAVTSAQSENVGGNRHDKNGPHDPEVGLVFIKRKSNGEPLALQLIYSMHPTVLHEDSTLASSDFPAYTRQAIESALPGVLTVYQNGTCGNLSPRYHVSGQTFEEAERLGNKLAEPIIRQLQSLNPKHFTDNPVLKAAQGFVELPPRDYPSLEEAEAELDSAVADYERLKRENAGHGPVRTAECTIFGAQFVQRLARARENGELAKFREDYKSIEVQIIQVNDHFLVAWPGEFFVEFGLELKRRAPRPTFIVTMANGNMQGYMVTAGATGYEAKYCFFEPGSAQMVVDATVDLMQSLL